MRAAPGSAALLGQGQELELGAPRQPSGGGGAGADAARLLAEQREEVQRLFSGFVAQLEALHVRHLDQHGACLQGTAQGRAAPAEAAAPPRREEAPPRAAGRGGAAAAGAPAPPEPSREASWGEVPAALQSFLAGMPRADGWRGQLQDVVHGHAFKSAVTCVIVLGIVAQAFEINDLLERQSEHQGEDDWGLWKFIETAVTVLFVLEVTLRIVADQWYFFLGSARYWNWLDLVLTAMDFFEALLDADGREHRSATIGAVRVFRILRFARVLRAVRLLAAFHSFRVMMLSIVHAMPSLSWAFLLLLVEVYVFSIFFSYGVVEFLREEYLRDGAADSPVASELKLFFGSLAQAMVSLFMCVTGGKDWGYLMHALGACSPVYAAALVVYIFVTLIGVMNVVNGIFVDSATLVSFKDQDIVVQYEAEKRKRCADKLKQWFRGSQKQIVSWEDLSDALRHEKVSSYFAALELEVEQAKKLYELLDVEDSNEVEIDAFVDGCMRLRGAARSVDLAMLAYQSDKMSCRWNAFMQFAEAEFTDLRKATVTG